MKFIAQGKYGYRGQYFRKGDVFDVDPVAFVPCLMQDLSSPKAVVAVKTEPIPIPIKEDKLKATEKKKTGK